METDLESVQNTPELKRLLGEIFSEDFMRAHTHFESFAAFQYSSAVILNWGAEYLIYSKTLLDNFVREGTEFDCWFDMIRAGTEEKFSFVQSAPADLPPQ